MNTNLLHSGHFVPNSSVPVFDDATPLSRVLDQIGTMGVSGFLVREQGQPKSYVKGFDLAEQLVQITGSNSVRLDELNQQPIREVLASFPTAIVPVSILEPGRAVTEAELQNQPDRVFGIVSSQGGGGGWYLNHETLLATLTPKPEYQCKRGHKNGSWNAGRCSQCPATLSGVTK